VARKAISGLRAGLRVSCAVQHAASALSARLQAAGARSLRPLVPRNPILDAKGSCRATYFNKIAAQTRSPSQASAASSAKSLELRNMNRPPA